jgi:hypothetical protein
VPRGMYTATLKTTHDVNVRRVIARCGSQGCIIFTYAFYTCLLAHIAFTSISSQAEEKYEGNGSFSLRKLVSISYPLVVIGLCIFAFLHRALRCWPPSEREHVACCGGSLSRPWRLSRACACVCSVGGAQSLSRASRVLLKHHFCFHIMVKTQTVHPRQKENCTSGLR